MKLIIKESENLHLSSPPHLKQLKFEANENIED